MKLTWPNYSTPSGDNETASLGELRDKVEWLIKEAQLNHQDIYQFPVFIEDRNTGSKYLLRQFCFGTSSGSLSFWGESDKYSYTAPDIRPTDREGEYWSSRGQGGGECSGFVRSRKAGERLLRMVKLVLETDTPKTRLDYRDFEPGWIQFKFAQEEFDLDLLESRSSEMGGIVTLEILKECKRYGDEDKN